METRYLVEGLNEMSDLLTVASSRRGTARQGELAQAAAIGCSTLIRLSTDEAFRRDIQLLAERQQKNFLTSEAITGDLDHFMSHFLQIEERILHDSGVDPHVVKVLRKEAESLRNAIHGMRIEGHAVQKHVAALQEVACSIARTFRAQHAQEEDRIVGKQRLIEIAIGMGGCLAIGLNAGTNLLSAAGTAVSGQLGVAIVTASATRIGVSRVAAALNRPHSK
jgi:hypothetical protein